MLYTRIVTSQLFSMVCLQHSQVRANPVAARSISQSSISTPIKSTPAITVKLPTTAVVTPTAGTPPSATTPVGLASVGVSSVPVTVKQEKTESASTHTVQKPGLVTTGKLVPQVSILVETQIIIIICALISCKQLLVQSCFFSHQLLPWLNGVL